MYGAILGDIIGSPYEFDRGEKSKHFPLFNDRSVFTDDTVMTIAVADALMFQNTMDEDAIRKRLIESMQKWGQMYPLAGYGGMFGDWLNEKDPKPYGSYGNGSAMRVSSVGWLYDTIEETRRIARLTAEVTHNHPEGIKGAESVASAIFLARTGAYKSEIRDYIVREFGYDLSRTCDEIRPGYHHAETCQETVPEAITAFLEGSNFIDVIRTAVSLGGDCDTLTCIAGSIAEAFFGVPEYLKRKCYCSNYMDKPLIKVLKDFNICFLSDYEFEKKMKEYRISSESIQLYNETFRGMSHCEYIDEWRLSVFDDKRVPFEYMCPMTETDAVFADRIERSQRAGKNLFFKEWRRIRNIPGIDYI